MMGNISNGTMTYMKQTNGSYNGKIDGKEQ